MQAFIYFQSDQERVPELLIDNLTKSLSLHNKIIVVTNQRYLEAISNLDTRIIAIDESIFLLDELEKLYYHQINNKVISSNHPPTELLCLKRWLALEKCYELKFLDIDNATTILDWDTFIFNSAKIALESIHDIAAEVRMRSRFWLVL